MGEINVNVAKSRATNTQLLPIYDKVNNVTIRLTSIQSSLDPRILSHNNLRMRMLNTRSKIVSIEAHLRNFHAGIANILNRYEEAELQVLRQHINLNNGGD